MAGAVHVDVRPSADTSAVVTTRTPAGSDGLNVRKRSRRPVARSSLVMSRPHVVVGPDTNRERPSAARAEIASCANRPFTSRGSPPSTGHTIHLTPVAAISSRPSGDTSEPVVPSGVSGRSLPDAIGAEATTLEVGEEALTHRRILRRAIPDPIHETAM